MLQKRQARETGICPVRRDLYSQCFGIYSNPFYKVLLLISYTIPIFLFKNSHNNVTTIN